MLIWKRQTGKWLNNPCLKIPEMFICRKQKQKHKNDGVYPKWFQGQSFRVARRAEADHHKDPGLGLNYMKTKKGVTCLLWDRELLSLNKGLTEACNDLVRSVFGGFLILYRRLGWRRSLVASSSIPWLMLSVVLLGRVHGHPWSSGLCFLTKYFLPVSSL